MHLLDMMESWSGVREACLCRDMSESPCSTRSLEVAFLSPMANIEFHAQEKTGISRLQAVTGCVVVGGEGLRPRRLGEQMLKPVVVLSTIRRSLFIGNSLIDAAGSLKAGRDFSSRWLIVPSAYLSD